MPAGETGSSVDAFWDALAQSGLFDEAQRETLRQAVPADVSHDACALADHLVKTGKLSRFQACQVLEGVTLGLVMGAFQILAPIGHGGMGAIYLARDVRTDQLAAFKVLPPELARAKERRVVRFRREMEICQRVQHPNLTRTIEVGTCFGVHFIAMEYIPGRNLNQLVTGQGPLAVEYAARIFRLVAEGLQYAHDQGIIHRDLKPSNIMVTPDGRVKVLDLGLALVQHESEVERTIVGNAGISIGTLNYQAPEQAEDAFQVDARTDIYALGCSLYFALTGLAPFPHGSRQEKKYKHRYEEPTPIEEINPTVPGDLAAVVRVMMAKKPADRPASAALVRDALNRWDNATDYPG